MSIFNRFFLAISLLASLSAFSQNLHTSSSCPPGQISGGVIWGSPAGAGEYDWPDGNTSFTATNINGTNVDVAFVWSGETASFGTLSGSSTPNVGTTLSGGTEIVEIVTNGFTGAGATLTMTISPPIPGEIGYEIYHMNRTGAGGAGDIYTIHATTTEGKIIYPTFTANGTPSWTETGPGVVDANANSTAGQNDQVGVNFSTNEYIESITMVWNDCSTCATNQFHGAAFGSFDFCLDDWDADGIPNVIDIDDDNDGITDEEEKCSENIAGGTLDWDSENWASGSATGSFTVAGVTIDGNISSDGNALSLINETNTLTGGTGENALQLSVNQTLEASTVIASWDFTDPVDDLDFDVFDIDLSGTSFIDSIRFVGFSFGEQIFPTLTPGASNSVNENSALATGTSGNTSANGNVNVSFDNTLDSLLVYFNNGEAANANPGAQTFAIHDFTWSRTCTNYDFDGDGVPNHLDLDSDNDGVTDLYESGIDYATILTLDTDFDGIMDPGNAEGANGLVDAVETAVDNGVINYTLSDTDTDGTLNRLDLDSDNDGISDLAENGNGTDANNDGIVDGSDDADNDGLLDSADSDDDNNGSPNTAATDTDSDGFPNFIDIDADNDGIVDNIEAQVTTGSPSVPVGSDGDSDGTDDTFESGFLSPVDSDNDGTPDYLDINSDGDGELDILEGWDTNNNGTANTLPAGTDSDGDGLDDNFDNVAGWNSSTNITNNGQDALDFPNADQTATVERDWREDDDTDEDGIFDGLDIDDDNDGILDVDEGEGDNNPVGDEDGDGIPNWADTTDDGDAGDGSTTSYADSNADGIPDVFDTDNDGIPNHLDLDSDNDGIGDVIEAGGIDSNGDGLVDSTTDDDGDGLMDIVDPLVGTSLSTTGDCSGTTSSYVHNISFNSGTTDVTGDVTIVFCVTGDYGTGGGFETISLQGESGGATAYDKEDSDNTGYADCGATPFCVTTTIAQADWNSWNNDGIVNLTFTPNANVNFCDDFSCLGDVTVSLPSGTSGEALGNPDTDGDGLTNHLDIDADGDGIVDIIEAQANGVITIPSGTDSDGDGIDDNFDTDSGNSLLDPINTDAVDNPDYTDTDSDNDGDLDVLEGWDTNNNGSANTSPAGTDTDGDGLDDNFDNIVGPNLTTNITNNGQTSASFPNLDEAGTTTPDWREAPFDPNDIDGDGIDNATDIDDDNDGILDVDENCINGVDVSASGTGSFTVPADGEYTISIAGGDGGGAATAGGSGASITSVFDLTNGDVIRYVVGAGTANGTSAGGAGSTGLFVNNTLMMVAGGGAGGDNSGGGVGLGASSTTTGVSGNGGSPGIGGAAGAGATAGGSNAGSGGGINSAGANGSNANGGAAADLVPGDGVTLVAGGTSSGGGFSAGGAGFTGGGGGSTGAFSGGGGGYSGGGAAGSGGGAGGGGSFLNTGAGSFVSGSITAGVTGGGGAVNSTGSDGSVSVVSCADTDNDGIIDAYDLDSDGDGIADIIEAGGVDTDGNGRVDDATDDDGDGWSNVFDSDDGGTALEDPDTDGDGFEDRIDIDADNDGIIDIIESQVSGVLISPSGTDTDGDGIDDNFDPDNGNALTVPTDTDGDTYADYIDLNSDDDAQGDLIEAWDSNNNGIANTLPSGTDSDGDGLDDNFDNIVGPNNTTNVTNSGQSSSSFPDLDNTASAERDWREFTDSDNDGIPDDFDIDDDNDGILDSDERNCTSGFADAITLDVGVATEVNALGAYDGNRADVATGDTLTVDLTDLVPANHFVRLRIRRENANRMLIQASADNVTFDAGLLYGTQDPIDIQIPVEDSLYYFTHSVGANGGRYIRVSRQFGALGFDAVGYAPQCASVDTDGDGVDDHLDLDADNDGIADIIEAGGVDVNGDGRVDDDTDTDEDGYADTFDNSNGGSALPVTDTDGDGIENYLDLDSDSDGILDNIESQTTLGHRAPQGSDTDGDGWDDEYDSDDGGSVIVFSNVDGDANPDHLDLDSDADGKSDAVEGFDDDNDGFALDDLIARATAYETAAGNPNHYVNTDDADADGVPDWAEDTDGDGYPNYLDQDNAFFVDTDGDGIINLFDSDDDGVASILPDTNNDGEYDFRDTDNSTAGLPIELLSFDASRLKEAVQLDWTTASEINNDYFIVERLNVDNKFVPILELKGAGNSNEENNYRTIDQNPYTGYNYYRLKQVDFDGEFAYSQLRTVYFESTTLVFGIYPNPSNGDGLKGRFKNVKPGRINWTILDETGKVIQKSEFNHISETKNLQIDLLNGVTLIPGSYFIRLTTSDEVFTEKIIIIKTN